MRIGFVAAAAAVLLASPAQAENWRTSSGSNEATGYIDTDSIRREGNRVLFWREIRFPEVQTLDDGLRFDRLAAHYEGDCSAMTLRTMRIRVGLGTRVLSDDEGDGEIQRIEAGSTADGDLRAACFGEWPDAD